MSIPEARLQEGEAMLAIVLTLGVSSLVLLVVVFALAWLFRARWAGPRGWPLLVLWGWFNLMLCSAVSGWVVAGIYSFVVLPDFWRGVWSGATALLVVGYVPALVWVIRAGKRQAAGARMAHTGLAG
jgi:hypothetical protein